MQDASYTNVGSRCCFKTTLKALAFLIRRASADDINKSDPLLERNRKRDWAMINIYGRWLWSIFLDSDK